MGNVAIEAMGLGKIYQIGARQEHYRTLRDDLAAMLAAPWRRAKALWRKDDRPRETSAFWALKDVSFDIRHGDVVGIVGKNGAGKSTLLKILSRITEPSEGRAVIRGRVASLLEVGTGFHLELTGRENIFLNGAILGMKRAEILRKFDEIVAFAEVEKFVDTPVKHYSSGMYLRLAFSVAAHLEPEILIVDEVLAVGDAAFQEKCLGKMQSIGRAGRTVLLVSHNMAAIRRLCTRGLFLDAGQIRIQGQVTDVINEYLRGRLTSANNLGARAEERRRAGAELAVSGIELCDAHRAPVMHVYTGDDLFIKFSFFSRTSAAARILVKLMVSADDGVPVFFCATSHDPKGVKEAGRDSGLICHVPHLPLARGRYTLSYQIKDFHDNVLDALDDAFRFEVELGDFFGTNADYHDPKVHVLNYWLRA